MSFKFVNSNLIILIIFNTSFLLYPLYINFNSKFLQINFNDKDPIHIINIHHYPPSLSKIIISTNQIKQLI